MSQDPSFDRPLEIMRRGELVYTKSSYYLMDSKFIVIATIILCIYGAELCRLVL